MHPEGIAAQVLKRWQERKPVARDVNEVFAEQMTFGQRVADSVAAFGGSWKFIGLFLPALQAPVIMMSQNRQCDARIG